MTEIKLTVDGKELKADPGTMIIQVADQAGIYIPRFCYHEKLSIAANCRMCLVEVEKAAKPLPACATPVVEGMTVHTASSQAVEAQKGTMEFLLINHPLDCPVCDQGGECPLQDQALGYGGGESRYTEEKRTVEHPDIGPLIETEMTRCIHCTRCVRFGQEIAGIMEFGAIGRGEEMKISTYIGSTVNSEISDNVIDLCPVGALTSKPYRFTARAWEMRNHQLISPHDCLGSNLTVQSVAGEVKRVLPRDNEAVNECWLSDRDRFSYEAVNSSDRLIRPLVRKEGRMEEVTWEEALGAAAKGLREVAEAQGGGALGALATPTATLEEFFLLQKLMRGLGSQHVDHRLRQQDFRDDAGAPLFPCTEIPVAQIPKLSAILLIGCNLRKELPLLAIRVRQLIQNGGKAVALNPLRYDFNGLLNEEWIVSPQEMPAALAAIALQVARERNLRVPPQIDELAGGVVKDARVVRVAQMLTATRGERLVVVGQVAAGHARSAELRAIASWMGANCGIRIAVLPDANGAAGWIAGCVPHRGPGGQKVDVVGYDAACLVGALSGYVLYGVEPALDYARPGALHQALENAEFVLNFSSFRSAVPPQASVALPLAPFTENAGSYINVEGRTQFSNAAVSPKGEARPGWKILRVLANLLSLEGFDYITVDEVTREVPLPENLLSCSSNGPFPEPFKTTVDGESNPAQQSLERILDVPLYAVDPVVRRATSLQQTRDNPGSAVYMHPSKMVELGLTEGVVVRARGADGMVRLPVQSDDRVPDGCVYIPTARLDTAALGTSQSVWLEEGR